jgi:hypothetical protein
MQLNHWTFLVEICYRFDLRKETSLLISNKAIIEYIYDSLNKCSGLPDTSKQTAETHLVFVTCYKAWTDTVLKTGVKMIAVSSMVHVYKIANEKLAYMYYFKKHSKLWPVAAGSSRISYEGNHFCLCWVLQGGKMKECMCRDCFLK